MTWLALGFLLLALGLGAFISSCTNMTPREELYTLEVSYTEGVKTETELIGKVPLTQAQTQGLLKAQVAADQALAAAESAVMAGGDSADLLAAAQSAVAGMLAYEQGVK